MNTPLMALPLPLPPYGGSGGSPRQAFAPKDRLAERAAPSAPYLDRTIAAQHMQGFYKVQRFRKLKAAIIDAVLHGRL